MFPIGSGVSILTGSDALRQSIQQVPFIDHHVHQPNRGHELTTQQFRRTWTESSSERVLRRGVPDALAYRMMVRQLAGLLDVEPDEGRVIAARNAIDVRTYHAMLADDANLGMCLVDHLFDRDHTIALDEWPDLIGREVREILRLETFIEDRSQDCESLDDALDALAREISERAGTKLVGLKSIAGYRGGLRISRPTQRTERQARDAFKRLSVSHRPRLEESALKDVVLWRAFELAAEHGLPVQFHVALGDEDIILAENDPALLRNLLEEPAFERVPVVLLHCYPFHRHAGYLASLYANVYVDLGLTIPLVGPGAARIVAEALEMTPLGQLLASSDGHGTPEFQWFAIRLWRSALHDVMAQMVECGALDWDEAETAAEGILGGTSCAIYSLTV